MESEDNLSHDGDAWIYDKAHVAGNAKVRIMRKYLVILKFMAIPKLLGMLEYLVMVN